MAEKDNDPTSGSPSSPSLTRATPWEFFESSWNVAGNVIRAVPEGNPAVAVQSSDCAEDDSIDVGGQLILHDTAEDGNTPPVDPLSYGPSVPGESAFDIAFDYDRVIALNAIQQVSQTIHSAQHELPARLYEHLHNLRYTGGLNGDVNLRSTDSSSMLDMIEELRKRDIFQYLVPQELEVEFHEVNRIQSAWANRGDNIARAVALVGYWLHKCLTEHPECQSPHFSGTLWPKLPYRVVDLSNYHPPPFSTESQVKVIETNGLRGAYCALSYRWPKERKESSMLSRRNLRKALDGIAANDLLSEIQDACTLAKGLGIQYLWVDALCIVQGLGGDWHIEAEKMSSIYMNALFTIAAVDKTPLLVAAQERPFVTSEQELSSCDTPFIASSPESIYLWLARSGNFVSRPVGKLDERGWAFQEKLLSTRIVSLTKEGVFWDCLHHSASDRRPVGILGDFSSNFQDGDDRKLKRFLLSSKPLISSKEYYWLWRRAVQGYTKRNRLIALEGITRQMTSILDNECVLGIWRKNTLRSLLWFVEPSSRVERSYIQAPSWSWISVNGPMQYRLWHPYARNVDRKGESVSRLARILELSATRENPLGFDRFTGRLTIKGAMINAYLLDSVIYCVRRLKDENFFEELEMDLKSTLLIIKESYKGDSMSKFYIEDALLDFKSTPEYRSVQKVQCLLLVKGGYTDMLTAQYCLILQEQDRRRLGSDAPIYKRIGLCAFITRHICVSSDMYCAGHHEGYSDCMGKIETVHIS